MIYINSRVYFLDGKLTVFFLFLQVFLEKMEIYI